MNAASLEIQAVWFSTESWNPTAAERWLTDNDFRTDVRRTREDGGYVTHLIYPQFDPSEADEDSFRTVADDWPDGVSVTLARRNNAMELQYTKGVQSADDPMEFVLSDEGTDRMGDVIKSDGWDLTGFKLNPIALFGHDHQMPIGTWENVRLVGKKLMGRLRLAAAGTSVEIDTIRKLVEQRILRAVSVGFMPTEHSNRDDGGLNFIKQELHEASLVSVPANPRALAVAKAMGADPRKIFADPPARGTKSHTATTAPIEGQGTGITKGSATRRVSRQHPTSPTRRKPMDISKRIEAKRERQVAIKDQLVELKSLLDDDEYEFTDDDQDRIDALTDEQESVIKSIESLERMEQAIAAKANPAQPFAHRGIANGAPAKKKKGGELLAKHVTAALFAKKQDRRLDEVYKSLYGHDDEVLATRAVVNKTAIEVADTTTTGWAKELVEEDMDAFLAELAPISVFGALREAGRGLNFNGLGSLKIPFRVPGHTGPNDLAGSWVGEGGVIPVKSATLSSKTLYPYKLAVISAWTNELDARSMPAIEGLVRDMMLTDTAVTLDGYLLDGVAAVQGTRPAGLLNGVTATASAGNTAANIVTDLKALFAAMQSARVGANPVLIMNSIRLLGLSTITTAAGGFLFRDEVAMGRLLGVPVIAAEHVADDAIHIVDAGSFVAANDMPMFNISDQATLTMANADASAPTQAEDPATAGDIGTADQVPPDKGIHVNEDLAQTHATNARAVSLFQTNSTAIRMVLPTAWGMVRPKGVASLSGVAW